MTVYKLKLGDKVIKVPCHILETGETLLTDLPTCPPVINSPCLQYVRHEDVEK